MSVMFPGTECMDQAMIDLCRTYHTNTELYTHVNLGGGKLMVHLNQYDTFMDRYSSIDDTTVKHIAERPNIDEISLYYDIDLWSVYRSTIDRLYTSYDYETLCELIKQVLPKYITDLDEQALYCVVLEKPMRHIKEENKLKHGFHIHFCNCFVSIKVVPHIFDAVMKLVEVSNLFTLARKYNEPLTFDVIMDKQASYINSWLMYNSSKDHNSGTYSVSCIIAHDNTIIPIDNVSDIIDHLPIYKWNDSTFQFEPMNEELTLVEYLTRLLSIKPHGRKIYSTITIDDTVLSRPVTLKTHAKLTINQHNRVIMKLRVLMKYLNQKYADDSHMSKIIGTCIYNATRGSNEGYKIYQSFAARSVLYCPDVHVLHSQWNSFETSKFRGELRYLCKVICNDRHNSEDIRNIVYAAVHNPDEKSILDSICNLTYEMDTDIANIYLSYTDLDIVTHQKKHSVAISSCDNYIFLPGCRWEYNNSSVVMDDIKSILQPLMKRALIYITAKHVVRQAFYNTNEMSEEQILELSRRIKNGDSLDDVEYEADSEYTQEEDNMLKKKIANVAKMDTKSHKHSWLCEIHKIVLFNTIDNSFIDKVNSNEFLMPFNNGVYDFKQKKWRKSTPEDYILYYSPLDWNEELHKDHEDVLECYSMLRKLFAHPRELEWFLLIESKMMIGYRYDEKMQIRYGFGRNGKSLFNGIERLMLGTGPYHLSTTVSYTLITEKIRKGAADEELASIEYKRLVIIDEMPANAILYSASHKTLCSNSQNHISTRKLYSSSRTFPNVAQISTNCNEMFNMENVDYATMRRIDLVPWRTWFGVDVECDSRLNDKEFLYRMAQALAYILVHIVADRIEQYGYQDFLMNIPEPDTIAEDFKKIKEEKMPIYTFLCSTYEHEDGSKVTWSDMYSKYKSWFKANYRADLAQSSQMLMVDVERILNIKANKDRIFVGIKQKTLIPTM